VIVTTAYPFWLEQNAESWKYEKARYDLAGGLIAPLPWVP
jgi:hypothetical protein